MKKSLLFLQLAWLQTIVAVLGSLYYSEVLEFTPCVLCWYQRIAMYPQVLILGIAAFKEDFHALRYTVPLTIIGLLISVYHNALYYHLIPASITPCKSGVSCTTAQVTYLGFITIPLMELAAFAVILTCSVLALKGRSKRVTSL